MSYGGRQPNKAARIAKPPATRYYRGSSKAESPFQKKVPKRKLSDLITRTIDTLLVIVIIFCLIYSLIVQPNPRIVTSSSVYHEGSAYQVAAAADLESFRDRNKLTFDEVGLVDKLRNQFPEISQASVELPLFGQKPVIRLSIAAPVFIFVSQGRNYLISADGVAVSQESKLPAAINLPRVNDESGFTAVLGKHVLGTSQVNFINQVVLQCRRAGVPVSSLVLPSQAQELDLKTKDEPYLVKFYLGGDPLVEVGQFLAARGKFVHDHIRPSQYLDVRIAGKIFYK